MKRRVNSCIQARCLTQLLEWIGNFGVLGGSELIEDYKKTRNHGILSIDLSLNKIETIESEAFMSLANLEAIFLYTL
jgi:hypothetical protein